MDQGLTEFDFIPITKIQNSNPTPVGWNQVQFRGKGELLQEREVLADPAVDGPPQLLAHGKEVGQGGLDGSRGGKQTVVEALQTLQGLAHERIGT